MRHLRPPTLLMLLTFAFFLSPLWHCPNVLAQITTEDTTAVVDPPTTNGQSVIGNTAGVSINAFDAVRSLSSTFAGGELNSQRKPSAGARLRACPRKPVRRLRFVSLPRLERVAMQRIAAGDFLTDEMKYLAGLVRADYLFVYPETGDVVIAGPAGDWRRAKNGNVLSVDSRQPVLHLEDLIVALRAFPYGGNGASEIGCSIDPTQQGLARMRAYVKSVSRRPPSAQVIAAGLKKSLGKQKVSVHGVPATTHFARVMLEADYRMKLIGIGLVTPAVPIKSYLSLARPRASSNGMARWYFTPQYHWNRISPDRHAMQLGATGASLIGEAELVAANGHRSESARSDRASKGFTTDFTRKYAELAKAEPIYAELLNVMDLSVIAAAIHFFDMYSESGWEPDLFFDRSKLNVETHDVPTTLPTAVNAVWKGRRLLTPVGGGVSIRSAEAFESMQIVDDSLLDVRPEIPDNLTDDQWWWESE